MAKESTQAALTTHQEDMQDGMTRKGEKYVNKSHYIVREQGKRILEGEFVWLESPPLSRHLKKVV